MSSSDPPSSLSAEDYAVFGVTLGISAVIGIFYAIKDRRSEEGTDGYLMGGRSLGMVPVSLSLSVSFMSAITVLGTPAEVYVYGTMYWWFLGAMLMVAIITAEMFLPLFYKLGIASTYEYLEKRFNRPVRMLTTITYVVENIFYIGIVIYAPSLALNAVTGFNLWGAVLSTGLVCIFYTTLGGLKAVIWTDVFQAVVMLIGFLVVTIEGSIQQGGFAKVWERCEMGGRIDFVHFEMDPRIRHTVWSILVGGTFLWLGIYAVGQSQVQRYLACKSVREAKGRSKKWSLYDAVSIIFFLFFTHLSKYLWCHICALYLNWIGLVVIISLSMMNGAILYSVYWDCDPLSTGKISATDQLLPLLSLHLFQKYPGLPGLVVSCVFSGSLSTVSSGINAMACVTVEDFVKPLTNLNETKYTWISKGLVIVYGLLCIGMAYVASQLGGVLEAALSILGMIGGPMVAIFTLGMIFPFANSLGAFVGLLAGVAMTTWVYVGSKTYPPGNEFVRVLPISTAGCVDNTNFSNVTSSLFTTPISTTMEPATSDPYPAIADLYSISYVYYSCLGFAATLIVGLVLSLASCGWRNRKDVDPSLIYFIFDHWLFSWLPAGFKNFMRCGLDIDTIKEEKFEVMSDAIQKKDFQVMTEKPEHINEAYVKYDNVDDKIDSLNNQESITSPL